MSSQASPPHFIVILFLSISLLEAVNSASQEDVLQTIRSQLPIFLKEIGEKDSLAPIPKFIMSQVNR